VYFFFSNFAYFSCAGTNRLLTFLKTSNNVVVHHVNTTDPSTMPPLLNSKTRLVLLETPTNPLLQIADIPLISRLVHEKCPQAIVVVDNTMMSPYLQRPLELGADIVYHSGTKYLSGHHDLMAGIIGVKDDFLAEVRELLFFIYCIIISNNMKISFSLLPYMSIFFNVSIKCGNENMKKKSNICLSPFHLFFFSTHLLFNRIANIFYN